MFFGNRICKTMTIVAKVEIPSRNSNEKKRKMMLCQKQVKEKEQELKDGILRFSGMTNGCCQQKMRTKRL